jgi:Uri superfamily endonuclease
VAPTGIYILILDLPIQRSIAIGRLRTILFPPGTYLYTGSAMGPGGLNARLARHLRTEKRRHWHIDYLREYAEIKEIWSYATDQRLECRWAAATLALPGARVPAPRFGASDCDCPAHLVHLETRPDAAAFARRVGVPPNRMDRTHYGPRA